MQEIEGYHTPLPPKVRKLSAIIIPPIAYPVFLALLILLSVLTSLRDIPEPDLGEVPTVQGPTGTIQIGDALTALKGK